MNTEPAVDATRCPLCGRSNACGMEAGRADEPCWCTQVTLTAAMLDRIPAERRGLACVCAACAAALAREFG
ncbi:MAG: cysteine-rich CWC family protein [Betaproteobacteria bacterium]